MTTRDGRPAPSSPAAATRMRANRRKDTGPELALRRELHRRGLRYRVDVAPVVGLRRRADVVFSRLRLAVFIDGCYWHGCPDHGTAHRSQANAGYWTNKIMENQSRDRDTDLRLEAAGWAVVRAWEHEPVAEAADRIEKAVLSRRSRIS